MVNKIFIRKMKGPGWYWMCHTHAQPITAGCCGYNWAFDEWNEAFEHAKYHARIRHGVRL